MSGDTSGAIPLNAEQKAALEALGGTVSFPPDYQIFLEGEPSHFVLLIKKGGLKVTQKSMGSTPEPLLAIRGPGELMGEEGVLIDEPRTATVTTITEFEGQSISAAELLKFVKDYDLWPTMYKTVVLRRRESDHQVPGAVRNKLARFLLELADKIGVQGDDGVVIESTLSQQDTAAAIGASREAVAKALKPLRDSGLVSTAHHRVVVHDIEGLHKLATNPQIGDTP